MTPEEIHAQLIAESERTSLPECYKNDLLVHDLTRLVETGSQEFIWVLRTCGTHLFTLDYIKDTGGNRPAELVRSLYGFGDADQRWYYFTHGALREITHDQAVPIAEEAVARHREALALGQLESL